MNFQRRCDFRIRDLKNSQKRPKTVKNRMLRMIIVTINDDYTGLLIITTLLP